jgi:hypothetical protein
MTTAPTPAPSLDSTPHHQKHDGLNDGDGGLLIPLSLAFGAMFITISGLCCCHYKDNIYDRADNLMGGDND